MRVSPVIRQILVFGCIGCLNTLIDLGVLNALFLIFGAAEGVKFTIFKSLSFLAAVGNSYILNKKFTFSSGDNTVKTASKFFSITILGFLINVGTASLVVLALSKTARIHPILIGNIGAILGTLVSLLANFFGYKFLVFKKANVSH